VATLVCFHAHPDDEAIATAGTAALAAAAGHRVVLVVATRGERGEPVPGVMAEGESLADRREAETRRSAGLLGAAAVHFLGYVDSGMMGEPGNDDPASFWQADVEDAAGRLVAVLREEGADVVTTYDQWGTYGHPDHIQVHRVGRRAAELAGLPPERVFEATVNRDRVRAQGMLEADAAGTTGASDAMAEPGAAGAAAGVSDTEPVHTMPDVESLGVPEALITHRIDVSPVIDRKRAAMRAHASQIAEEDFFLRLDDDAFRVAFGVEWYICQGRARPACDPFGTDLFAEVPAP
jgi:LmbE family N-acetylglucosaminyl deacetylase